MNRTKPVRDVAATTPQGSASASTACASLWARPVIVGTRATLAGLSPQLEALGIEPAGCVITEGSVDPTGFETIAGLPVLGTLENLATLHHAKPISIGVVCLPGGDASLLLRVRSELKNLGIPDRVVPTLEEILGPTASAASAPRGQDVNLVELIGRTPYGIDRRAVARVLEGKRVLITGAGGSIGSELCRIVASFGPEQLILMERSENALFEVDRRLARQFPRVRRRALLHDVVDADSTMREVMTIRPHAVFHAAAHKHVPLMEDHPFHAVTNNLMGTKSIADASAASGAERFVMISSDKAVNPTSVMGATKRLAEMYVQALGVATQAHGVRTAMSMVRFGNVLGSACSVLPIWGQQLAEGGPITVTDPRMTRYFMTIHEAATLVIQSSALASNQGPAIYVLDMGEPLRILDLAERFVRLNGFEPRVQSDTAHEAAVDAAAPIDIVFSGARPGEKIHEELQYGEEALSPTPHPGILCLRGSLPAGFDMERMVQAFTRLGPGADRSDVVNLIRAHVPEMVGEDAPSRAGTPVPRSAVA